MREFTHFIYCGLQIYKKYPFHQNKLIMKRLTTAYDYLRLIYLEKHFKDDTNNDDTNNKKDRSRNRYGLSLCILSN